MERKNDAIGRTFTETMFVKHMGKDKDGKPIVLSTERVDLPTAPREYSIAGRYTRALSDAEVAREYPPLRDPKTGKVLPSLFPTVQTQSTKKGRR